MSETHLDQAFAKGYRAGLAERAAELLANQRLLEQSQQREAELTHTPDRSIQEERAQLKAELNHYQEMYQKAERAGVQSALDATRLAADLKTARELLDDLWIASTDDDGEPTQGNKQRFTQLLKRKQALAQITPEQPAQLPGNQPANSDIP